MLSLRRFKLLISLILDPIFLSSFCSLSKALTLELETWTKLNTYITEQRGIEPTQTCNKSEYVFCPGLDEILVVKSNAEFD